MYDLLARVRRRTGNVLRDLLPYNEYYRPVGIHLSSKDLAAQAGSKALYTEVYPEYVSELVVPEVFNLLRPSYYEPVAERERMSPAFVLSLPGGRLNADNRSCVAVIAADNHLVGDASLQYSPTSFVVTPPSENPVMRQRYFKAPLQVAGTVCSLLSGGGAAIGNYYHWLLDSLPRLHLVQEAGLWDSIDYFLIYDRKHRFAVETLLKLGIRDEQILDVQQHSHICADQLVVTSPVRGNSPHAPVWAGEFMKQAYLPAAAAIREARHFSPYVYVSRRDASFRQVRNEVEVEALLAEYGFESYALSELGLLEKAALFSGARVVVGPVGAGLVNIMFCAAGTALVEFLPRNFFVADYLDLTARLGMSHYPLVSPDDAVSGHRASADRQEDLTVDLEALQQALQVAMPEREPACS
jgi:capsular polysaccharide biosynthesis protein